MRIFILRFGCCSGGLWLGLSADAEKHLVHNEHRVAIAEAVTSIIFISKRPKQLNPVDDGDHHLPAAASRLDCSAVGVGRSDKWHHGIDEALKLTRVEQSGYLRQFFLVRLDDKECFFDALVLGPLTISGNGDHAA